MTNKPDSEMQAIVDRVMATTERRKLNSGRQWTYCKRLECWRLASTASEIGFAEFCCRMCAEGKGHNHACDASTVDLKERISAAMGE